jgi:hypothetical protein
VVVFSIRLRISRAVAIGKVLLQLMDARTFVRNHDGIKTGYTEDVRTADDIQTLGLYPVLEGHWASPVLVWKQERRRNASLALFSSESEVSTPFGHSSL